MPNYENAIIYKIVDNTTGNIYIGSTCSPIHKRLNDHKAKYNYYLRNKCPNVTSFDIIKNGDYYIEVIEECDVKNKNELALREQHYIKTMKCINKQIPGRTKKEYYNETYESFKESRRRYVEENKEKIANYKREWSQQNKERLYERRVENDKKNKERNDISKRKYYEANRELINARMRARRLAKKLAKEKTKKTTMKTTVFY